MSIFERARTWAPFGAVPEIAPDALHAELSADPPPVIVDVRTGAEWRAGHIEGALSIPIHELDDRMSEIAAEPGRKIVAICLSAHRSIPAVRLLRARGFEHVVQLRGGMLAWWAMRLPTCR